MLRFLLLLISLIAAPAAAQPRVNAIQPELVAEGPVRPGGEVELAILMHTADGWHGYWQNPGDAGLPMKVDWTLPEGASVGALRYPVPERLTIAGLMNYVYERDHAVLVRFKAPLNATGTLAISAEAQCNSVRVPSPISPWPDQIGTENIMMFIDAKPATAR